MRPAPAAHAPPVDRRMRRSNSTYCVSITALAGGTSIV
jgi:hypothetical protein